MAKFDTDYFDPSKHSKPEAQPPPKGDPSRRHTEEFRDPPREPERPRRRPGNAAQVNMRHSKLPDISRLLIMAAWMRDSPPPDLERAKAFRSRLRNEIDTLRHRLSDSDLGPHDGELCANFVACALDNAALNGPYREAWRENQIAAELFESGHGGEGFFETVRKVVYAAPGEYSTTVIEVALLCLVCGFEGRYAARESRDRDLAKLKGEIIELLHERETSDTSAMHRGNVEARPYTAERAFPLWATALAGLALVGVALVVFKIWLESSSQPSQQAIASLGAKVPVYREAIPPPLPAPAQPAPPPAWIDPLRAFCLKNSLDCAITETSALITLNGPEAFASASADLTLPLATRLQGLGRILELSSGPISVSGHSDRHPIRSFAFANNIDLSRKRAESVSNLIGAELTQTSRLVVRGVGEAKPICAEATPICDERNRRVELSLESGAR